MDQETVDKIREFNRFYTVLQGFLNKNYLDSGYSVTETRILFEIGRNPAISASGLIEQLRLDKGYISRLMRGFEQKGLVTRQASAGDGRARNIILTPQGEREAQRLIEVTNQKLSALIAPLDQEARRTLCAAMDTIMGSFSGRLDQKEGG